MFFIKHIWPDAVLVELDVTRYNALQGNSSETDGDKADKMFEQTAKYQQKLAENNRSSVGNEMLTAVQTGKLVGAEIGLIDDDARNVVEHSLALRHRGVMEHLRGQRDGRDRCLELMGHVVDEVVLDFREPLLPEDGVDGEDEGDEQNQGKDDGRDDEAHTGKDVAVQVRKVDVEQSHLG